MMDSELPPLLREAYERRDDEERTSDLLLERTVAELRSRGLLRVRRSGRIRYWTSLAAAVVVGFVAGEVLRGYGQHWNGEGDLGGAPIDVVAGLEEVQRLGGEHARAVETLAAAMDGTDGETFRSAQEVLLSSSTALRAATRGFFAAEPAPRRVSDVAPPQTSGGLIWF